MLKPADKIIGSVDFDSELCNVTKMSKILLVLAKNANFR